MKVLRIALALGMLLLILMTALSCAAEQVLPGIDVFSPGLVRLSEKMQENPAVHMTAEISAEDAFYVRDTSVLGEMLKGTSFIYDGVQTEAGQVDRLQIVRGDETLFDAQMRPGAAAINGEALVCEEEADTPQLKAVLNFAGHTAILERAPLEQVEAFLLSFEAGDALLGGYVVAQPFASVRTMSDDGTRLTRINLSGSIAREGEAPWVIEGYLKQPAGRAPKDTFELTATQDEKNWLELSYSSTRQSEITKKNKAGKASVDTHVKIAGEIGGYRVSERLTSYLRNTWTADGENLTEKIVVSMTLEHSDNTPGREMQRMNRAEAKTRHEIRLTTADAGNDVLDLTDAMTLSVVMDENTVLTAAADAAITVGKGTQMPEMPQTAVQGLTLEDALERAAQEMAKKLYAQLSGTAKEKILTGIE